MTLLSIKSRSFRTVCFFIRNWKAEEWGVSHYADNELREKERKRERGTNSSADDDWNQICHLYLMRAVMKSLSICEWNAENANLVLALVISFSLSLSFPLGETGLQFCRYIFLQARSVCHSFTLMHYNTRKSFISCYIFSFSLGLFNSIYIYIYR